MITFGEENTQVRAYSYGYPVFLKKCPFLFEMPYSLIQTFTKREVMVLVLVLKSIALIFFSFLHKDITHISIAHL